jgi:OOP family OmpA-OmpF porin
MNIFVPFLLASMELAIVFSTFVSPSAYAGNRPGALTVTLGGGYVYLSTKRHMDNKAASMVKLGYDFTEHWSVDAMWAGFHTYFTPSLDDPRRISGTLFALDALYHFIPDYAVTPYLFVGVGMIGLSPNIGADANNEGNLNLGAGAQWFIHNTFALQLEARDLYTWVDGKNDVFVNAGISALIDIC